MLEISEEDPDGAPDPNDESLQGLLWLSRGTAVILLVVYVLYLNFQVCSSPSFRVFLFLFLSPTRPRRAVPYRASWADTGSYTHKPIHTHHLPLTFHLCRPRPPALPLRAISLRAFSLCLPPRAPAPNPLLPLRSSSTRRRRR